MNFDEFDNIKYCNPNNAFPYLKGKIVDADMYYFLLDEIQLLNCFESVLNGLLRYNNVDIYVTGSNAKFLSKDVITEFRGRGDQVHVYPLSFSEFYEAKTLDEYLTFGGIPLIISMNTHESKISFLKKLFVETYIKDIVDRNNLSETEEMQKLVNIIASSICSLTKPNKLSNSFKSIKRINISAPTINKYLDYLIDSFLIEKAIKYNVKGKKYIDTPCKYYFSDLGIRNASINFRQNEKTHLMENLIYNELLIRGYI